MPLVQEADLDGKGTIDKYELGKLLMKISPLDHPVDDVDAIFDEVDTNRNGVIEPEEFKNFLEATLLDAEQKGISLNTSGVSTRPPHSIAIIYVLSFLFCHAQV